MSFIANLASVLLHLVLASTASAADYHTVSWVNTILPGGGEFLLGNTKQGLVELGLEGSTFGLGFGMSKRSPFSLDGVPEDLPGPVSNYSPRKFRTCRIDAHGRPRDCTTSTTNGATLSSEHVDVSHAIIADWLQEFGLKYHMVNVFNTYRKAAGPDSATGDQFIDPTPTDELFLAPFRVKNLTSAWVYPALLVTAAAIILDYQAVMKENQLPTIAPLNTKSQRMYDTTYLAVYPAGGAAPEEMFYRGFLQHEAYGAVRSPWFSVPVTSAAYAFSHQTQDRLSAAVEGIYLGIMTHATGGALSTGIAYHFWANVMAGFYQIAIVRRESGKKPLFQLKLSF